MKCVICYSEDIVVKEVREEFVVGEDIVYIPVEVPVCGSCGERYCDGRTMRLLEETKYNLNRKQVELRQIGKVYTAIYKQGVILKHCIIVLTAKLPLAKIEGSK